MIQKLAHLCLKPVALRKESVDRNATMLREISSRTVVALRKESVDRNLPEYDEDAQKALVALRKESVDRNL